MKPKDVEVANFVCRFGEKKMLSEFETRVYPLFKEEIDESYGERKGYFFYEIKLDYILKQPTIYGRLVQRLTLKSHQVFKRGIGLTRSDETLPSDPSTIFALRLSDHKFFIIPEQPRSPRMKVFEKIFTKLLNAQWYEKYSDEKKRFLKVRDRKIMNKDLLLEFNSYFEEIFPEPDFRLSPIGDAQKAEDLLDAFYILKNVKISNSQTNNEDYELDEELLQQYKLATERTHAKNSDLNFSNPKIGLEKENVKHLIGVVAKSGGNLSFSLKGKTQEGTDLVKTDHDSKVKLKILIGDNDDVRTLIEKAFTALDNAIREKIIIIAKQMELIEDQGFAAEIVERIRGNS
ncbi:hypothetical protein FBR05_01775 [Deltaproteobacteria bacterium PRO3]|nr:hypothetical protein [Deltaproteobacteria bacterium PRO3]